MPISERVLLDLGGGVALTLLVYVGTDYVLSYWTQASLACATPRGKNPGNRLCLVLCDRLDYATSWNMGVRRRHPGDRHCPCCFRDDLADGSTGWLANRRPLGSIPQGGMRPAYRVLCAGSTKI